MTNKMLGISTFKRVSFVAIVLNVLAVTAQSVGTSIAFAVQFYGEPEISQLDPKMGILMSP